MPVPSTIKRLSLCAAGLLVAGLSGLSLGNFAQGSAFSFYKERVMPWPSYSMSQPDPQGHSYPVDPGAAQPASIAGENPVDALYRDDFDPASETGDSLAAYDADAAVPLELPKAVETTVGESGEISQISWTRPGPSQTIAISSPGEDPPADDARDAYAAEVASSPLQTDSDRISVPNPGQESIRP